MKRHPIVVRSRAKAIALEAEPLHVDWWRALIHAIMTFLGPLLLFALLTACIPREDGVPVDYGPQVSPSAINDELNKPVEALDPASIKLGEFRAIEQTQQIIGIPGITPLSAQGVTITARDEQPDKIMLQAVITEVQYKGDGTFDKVSREGPVCVSKVQGACGEEAITGSSTVVSKSSTSNAFVSPMNYLERTVKTMAETVTFHRLKVTKRLMPVPELVKARANCGGVVDCEMDVTTVSFDQVIWSNGKGERIHVDVALSPSVPFLSNQLQSCFTGLAAVGRTSDVLVRQCSTIYDFRREAE